MNPINNMLIVVICTYNSESTVYVTGASGLHRPRRLPYSNWKVGSVDLVTFVVFDLIVCDLRVVTEKCYTLNY